MTSYFRGFGLVMISAIIIALSLTSVKAGIKKEQDNSKEIVMKKLAKAASDGEFCFGHQDSYFYGKNWVRGEAEKTAPWRSDIKDVCGDFPAVLGCDLGGIELGLSANLDGVQFDLMREAIKAHHKMGGIVTLSWHQRNPLTNGTSWDSAQDSVIRYILPGHPGHVKYLKWLDKIADYIIELKDDNGNLIPLIFRPYHEHTEKWFWWGVQDSTPDDYKQMWRMTYKYLISKGLTNLIWAYSPNLGTDKDGYMRNYPGDDYVDILGYDGYQFGEGAARDTYLKAIKSDMAMLKELGIKHNKLIAVTETGYEAIPDKDWWTKTLMNGVKGSGICYLLVWRNAHNQKRHYYAPFPGEHSAEDFLKFYDLPETLFLNDLK